jgi:guanylate kinase
MRHQGAPEVAAGQKAGTTVDRVRTVGTTPVPRVVTLTGPSGCGKSTVVAELLACANSVFVPKLASKYTTRPARAEDGPEIISVSEIPQDCDLAYEHAGIRYGQRSVDVVEMMTEGVSPLVILSDVRSVSDLRRKLGPNVLSLYIHRANPSREVLLELAGQRNGAAEEYERRYEKARSAHRIYMDNISLFDHVVLNAHSLRWTRVQLQAIVNSGWRVHGSVEIFAGKR